MTDVAPAVVHLLWHTHELDDGDDDEKLLGVYSSREHAQMRVVSASDLPGFRDHVTGFEISAYELDKDEWREGFVTCSPDPDIAEHDG